MAIIAKAGIKIIIIKCAKWNKSASYEWANAQSAQQEVYPI